MVETTWNITLIMMGIFYMLGSPVEAVNTAILFKIHLTRMMRSLCRGATFVVYVEHFLYIDWKCGIILVGNRLD